MFKIKSKPLHEEMEISFWGKTLRKVLSAKKKKIKTQFLDQKKYFDEK